MKVKNVTRINFPAWACCLHEYGERGDLSEEDVKAYYDWAEDNLPGNAYISFCDSALVGTEEYFTSCPAFGLPGTCVAADLVEFEED